jgi:hypothetical protein
MPRVYLETTIPSYLTARPSRDILRAAEQEVTRTWWERREFFELYVSELVLAEVAAGNPGAAQARLGALVGIPVLGVSEEARALATALVDAAALPSSAALDALHIAIAACNGMDFLLTWNCRHIANAVMRPHIERTCRTIGFEPPVICTPRELWEPE